MELKEEKPTAEQQLREKTIPVFTVLKNGALLKNIFVVNSRDFSSPGRIGDAVSDEDEVEEILLVGRHPDCDILLTHPSISRFHLQIRSVPSRQKLFVTDLSSVHGTWITDRKVEPDACVEVKEGDVIRIGGSTRMYRLHWIPLSRAYDVENPFVSPLDASTVMEQDELSEIGGEGNTEKEVPFPSPLTAETFEDTKAIEELRSYYTHSQENQTQQPHAVSEIDSFKWGKAASVPLLEASGCSAFEMAAEIEILSPRQEVSGEIVVVTEQVMESASEPLTKADTKSHEDNGETEVSRQVFVSPSSIPQIEPTLTGDARRLLGSEAAIETDSENLHQKCNGETKTVSRQASAVSDCLFAGNECLSRISKEEIGSLCSSWEALSEIWSEVNPAGVQNQISAMNRETEKVFDEGSSSSCHSEEHKKSGTQSFLLTPNQKPETEMSIGSGRSEESYSLSEMVGEGNTDKRSPIPSILAAEAFEDRKPVKERAYDYGSSQENQSKQAQAARDGVLSELDSSTSSSRRLSTCNIWSRRGKAASVLQVRTNKSEGKKKQTGEQPKAQLHRKQVLGDKSISLTVHHGVEKLEPEIFTPDKENLTPRSHMLKRLQDIGDIKDSKSSSKLSGKSCSNIAILTSGAFTEPEIFTPDKENLSPSSHMLKRLREVGEIKDTKGSSSKATRKPFFDTHLQENVVEEQKPDVHFMSSESKVAPKKKATRAPFQTLLEKPSSQGQSYTEASSTASARNNISRCIRSSSNLSDGNRKMKWTIVLDTSSLLDKESRKPLHLLQGLKGTHLVVPRTVLRELNDAKRTRGLLSRRRAETASSALDWIEECIVNTKLWIQLQSPSEETKATAPTPPVTPQSYVSSPFPFSWNTSNNHNNAPEIDSPTSEDQVLECALLYGNRNVDDDEKLVLVSNDANLKIKAMAEGIICETAHEFYESLKNPFSERFMWTESLPRGRTWSLLDDVVLRERYNNNNRAIGAATATANAKGLKLILLHNSHYGHSH